MLSENEAQSVRMRKGAVLILGVAVIVVILVSLCVWSVSLLTQKTVSRSAPLPSEPAIFLSTAMPANLFEVHLPLLSRSVSVTSPDLPRSAPEQIWEVTNVTNLGYEMDGQYYDLATFTRTDGQDTVIAYCINRGWNVPEIGTEYLLNAEGIFVPLYESDVDPIQRFLETH